MEVKTLRTTGTEKEILEKNEGDIIHLFISSVAVAGENHDIGDILINEESNTRYALSVKEDTNCKILIPALRVSIINLIKHLLDNAIPVKNFLISRHQFINTKEQLSFVCIFKELCMTYFGEVLTEPITIIITDYKE